MRMGSLALLLALLTAGCAGSDGSGESAPSDDPTTPDGSEALQFRLVLASDYVPGSCDEAAPACDPAAYDALDCDAPPQPAEPAEVAYACQDADAASGAPAIHYALEPARIVGGVESAESGLVQGSSYGVTIQLDDAGAEEFAALSADLAGTDRQFAMLLDGRVLSAPTIYSAIDDGQAQITGSFTEEQARALAESIEAAG